jgi:NADH dehydrogenase
MDFLMNSHNTPSSPLPRVVIVGAGFGGLEVARGLADAPVTITLIDRQNYHLFQPLLYQVATAALSPAQIAQPIRSIIKDQSNCSVVLGEVTGVDAKNKSVKCSHGDIPYDYLVLATGATQSYFGKGEWAATAPGLKTIDDALRIRQHILKAFESAELTTDHEYQKALMTFVVVGGGPTGVEMAGAIAELSHRTLAQEFRGIDPRQARVILVEAGQRLLSAFPETLSTYTRRALEKLDVEVRTECVVTDCTPEGITAGGEYIPARTIIWAAGVKASPAAEWLEAAHDRAERVIVQPDLSVPGYPSVFVIGDTAAVTDAKGLSVPGLAPAAEQQGAYVAAVIKSRVTGQPPPPPFTYRDLGIMATIGWSKAIAKIGRLRMTGFWAWWLWSLVHILPLVGFRNRIVVSIDWIWSYITQSRGVRLITKTDPQEDEKKGN